MPSRSVCPGRILERPFASLLELTTRCTISGPRPCREKIAASVSPRFTVARAHVMVDCSGSAGSEECAETGCGTSRSDESEGRAISAGVGATRSMLRVSLTGLISVPGSASARTSRPLSVRVFS